jgi:hypothetical protein
MLASLWMSQILEKRHARMHRRRIPAMLSGVPAGNVEQPAVMISAVEHPEQ